MAISLDDRFGHILGKSDTVRFGRYGRNFVLLVLHPLEKLFTLLLEIVQRQYVNNTKKVCAGVPIFILS